jgi:hypothetical protein
VALTLNIGKEMCEPKSKRANVILFFCRKQSANLLIGSLFENSVRKDLIVLHILLQKEPLGV